MSEYSVIGKSIPRVDGPAKVTGEALYSADIKLPGMLIGKIKASPYPFARILSVNTEKALRLSGVEAVISAQNVSQFLYGAAGIDDELPMADKLARYAGDAIAAVAAVNEETAQEALDLIEVDYEELTPVLDVEEAMNPGAPAVHPEREKVKQNIAHRIEYVRGEGEAAFKQADLMLEERFSTQAQHQAYIEPQACVAQWDASGKLTLWGGTQRAFTARFYLAKALGIPGDRVRLIQPFIGGGFGGKEEMHPYFPIAALLTREVGKPVQIVYTREEDFISGRPRLSQMIDLRLGFKKDGTMVAKSAVINANTGPYTGICPAMISVSAIRPDCLYRQPNIKMMANLIYTNSIPKGAFRGFGNPEMLFAMESLIDMAADQLGIDPVELRMKNAVRTGDTTVHGWMLRSCGFKDTLRIARQESGWNKKKQKKGQNHGFGVASQVHVAGNKAIAKQWGYEGSAAIVNVDQYGKVKVISGESDMGQGVTTTFAQIAAEALGVNIADVGVTTFVDTDIAPFCLGTFASRVTVLGGNAVLTAAKDARRQLLKHAAEKFGIKAGDLEIRNSKLYVNDSSEEVASVQEIASHAIFTKLSGIPITGRGEYQVPDYVIVPDKSGYGNYSLSYTFGTAIAEVEVDPETGKVDVLNIWYVANIGKVLNPKSAEGQLEGGIVQGIGYALTEDYIWEKGRIMNPNFTDYKIPEAVDLPEMHCFWVEHPNPGSPYGAKSVAEPVLNPIAPAIASAVYNAVGVRIKDLPLTPEKVLNAIKIKSKGG